MPMRGLTIIVAARDAERLHAALTFAAAAAAAGGSVRVHLHEGAVALVRPPVTAPADNDRHLAGIPALGEILEECFGLGVALSLCQSGLAMAGMALDELDERFGATGPVGVLRESSEDHVLVF